MLGLISAWRQLLGHACSTHSPWADFWDCLFIQALATSSSFTVHSQLFSHLTLYNLSSQGSVAAAVLMVATTAATEINSKFLELLYG
jgi:hypothetical protein